MTDDQITAVYQKALGLHLDPVNLERARKFIDALFDALPVAGYLDPDGGFAQEEWEAGADCVEVFRRPE